MSGPLRAIGRGAFRAKPVDSTVAVAIAEAVAVAESFGPGPSRAIEPEVVGKRERIVDGLLRNATSPQTRTDLERTVATVDTATNETLGEPLVGQQATSYEIIEDRVHLRFGAGVREVRCRSTAAQQFPAQFRSGVFTPGEQAYGPLGKQQFVLASVCAHPQFEDR